MDNTILIITRIDESGDRYEIFASYSMEDHHAGVSSWNCVEASEYH